MLPHLLETRTFGLTVGWRAAFWVCVLPLLFAPVLAKLLPESLSFLVAKGRGEEAMALAERYDVEVPAASTGGAGDRWTNLANLFRGNEWIQTLLYWVASFGGLLLVYGVATWLPTLMRAEGYELGSALSFVVASTSAASWACWSRAGPPTASAPRASRRSGSR